MPEITTLDELQIVCFRENWRYVDLDVETDKGVQKLMVNVASRDVPSDRYKLTFAVTGQKVWMSLGSDFDHSEFVLQNDHYIALLVKRPQFAYEFRNGKLILFCRGECEIGQVKEVVYQ